MEAIWTEKYRPLVLDDIVGQEQVVRRLKSFVKNKSLPHLLFAGAAGTGKTTSALAISREIFGEEWRRNILELNASDERGIDVIRNKVKNFARTRAIGDVPFKIIYLDESDALTREAQQALRRTMENYAGTCRFILSCNYSSKIIDPIQSRCSVFRFGLIDEESIMGRLKEIGRKEKLELEKDGLAAVVQLADGDLRNAINILQAAASVGKKVSEKHVFEVASQADPKEVEKIIKLAVDGKFLEARGKIEDLLIKEGVAPSDIIKEIHGVVMKMEIGDKKKIEFLDRIGEYEFRIVEGSDPRIQLSALIAQFSK